MTFNFEKGEYLIVHLLLKFPRRDSGFLEGQGLGAGTVESRLVLRGAGSPRVDVNLLHDCPHTVSSSILYQFH
jgi:hypothetical protein